MKLGYKDKKAFILVISLTTGATRTARTGTTTTTTTSIDENLITI